MIFFENTHPIVRKYVTYLKLEKSLSAHSVEAYLSDMEKMVVYFGSVEKVQEAGTQELEAFLCQLRDCGIHPRSQARILSGMKSFYRFLMLEKVVELDPTELLDAPRLGRHLPEVLSVEEIDAMVECIDLSAAEGQRNKAILETLYGCGLRVSELTSLRCSHCYFEEEYVAVEGKGGKQRLVPISPRAIHEVELWLEDRRRWPLQKGNEDFVFLNRRGAALSRSMIFRIVQNLADLAGIQRAISPHTFRHSFATHLLEGGGNLRAIQQMLGHESIQTTEIYTHMDKTYLREQMLQFHPRHRPDSK
jgi:integrase/recombinase XerD